MAVQTPGARHRPEEHHGRTNAGARQPLSKGNGGAQHSLSDLRDLKGNGRLQSDPMDDTPGQTSEEHRPHAIPDTEGGGSTVEPGSIDARAERQHDAQFEVLGPAPEWALRMWDNVPGSGD
jgi:hypothetical protein